jgi:hypothetical protein
MRHVMVVEVNDRIVAETTVASKLSDVEKVRLARGVGPPRFSQDETCFLPWMQVRYCSRIQRYPRKWWKLCAGKSERVRASIDVTPCRADHIEKLLDT